MRTLLRAGEIQGFKGMSTHTHAHTLTGHVLLYSAKLFSEGFHIRPATRFLEVGYFGMGLKTGAMLGAGGTSSELGRPTTIILEVEESRTSPTRLLFLRGDTLHPLGYPLIHWIVGLTWIDREQ